MHVCWERVCFCFNCYKRSYFTFTYMFLCDCVSFSKVASYAKLPGEKNAFPTLLFLDYRELPELDLGYPLKYKCASHPRTRGWLGLDIDIEVIWSPWHWCFLGWSQEMPVEKCFGLMTHVSSSVHTWAGLFSILTAGIWKWKNSVKWQ